MNTCSDLINGQTIIQLITAFCFASLFAKNIGKLFENREPIINSETIKKNQGLINDCKIDNDKKADIINKLQALNRQLDTFRMNADEYLQVTPVCFDYACLLVGAYGIFCLWLIPCIEMESSFYAQLFSWVSMLIIIPIIAMVIIEILIRCRKDSIIKLMHNQHLYIYDIELIVGIIFISYMCAWLVPYQPFKTLSCCIWYNISICILAVPFVKAYLFYYYDNKKLSKIRKQINDAITQFNALYVKLKSL